MKTFFSTTLFLVILLPGFSQGKVDGFYNNKNQITLVAGGGYEDSKSYVAGDRDLPIERDAYYLSLYGLYGITDNLNVSISIPYIKSDQNKNLQDLTLFLKYRLHTFNLETAVIETSVSTGFSTPLSNYRIGGLNDIGQQATIIESRAIGHYKHNSGWFGTIQSGFSYKLEEVPNSLPVILKVGKGAGNWYYDLYYDYQYTFGGVDYLGTPPPQNFREFGVNYQKLGATIYRNIYKNLGMYITYSYVLNGRNIFIGPAYGIGISYSI